MKAVLLLALCPLLASAGETITFTNLQGRVFKDVSVSTVYPDGFSVLWEAGGAKVLFTNVPSSVQEHFHYDPRKAGQFAREQADKKQRAALMLKQREEIAKLSSDEKAFEKAVEKSGYKLSGECFQVQKHGFLLYKRLGYYPENIDLFYFIEDYPAKDLVDERAMPEFMAYPIGSYTYTTAAGAARTVERYTASLAKAIEWHRAQVVRR